VARCRRVKAAIEARYPVLMRDGLLVCGMTVQAKQPGGDLEIVSENDMDAHGH
jgi:hypothetical protein